MEHLKSSYRRSLWLFAIVNVAIFWSVVVIRDFTKLKDVFTAFSAIDAALAVLVPVGMIILYGLVSSDNKARLVFWRIQHPLPGCFAFSKYLPSEHRADADKLAEKWGELPTNPAAQNKIWYKMYLEHENDPRILENHREFLFARDLTGFAVVFLVVFGIPALAHLPTWSAVFWYVVFLLVQYLLLMIAARTYGERLVCNVIALESAAPETVF